MTIRPAPTCIRTSRAPIRDLEFRARAKVSTAATRLERRFEPDAVRELKAEATSDLVIGGADLAARAFEAGLVDECQLFVWPMILGGGKPAFAAGVRANPELLDEHRFGNGIMHLRYRVPD